MNRIILAVSILLVSLNSYAGINQECPTLTAAGVATYAVKPGDQEICHKNYAVIHSCAVKAPIAVFERLSSEDMTGPAKRKDDFRPDPKVTPACSATLADYATVGKTHDRGHMSPAGNNTQDPVVMSESFFLSNMEPQVANNNRGIWKQLETYERERARQPGTDYYIISGGIFDAGFTKTGNGLGIPTRLYKIIIEKNSKKVRAYLMPNGPLPVADLPKYETTVANVESATGLKFALPK
jgi:endonuclease G